MKKTHLALIVLINILFYLPVIFSSVKFFDDDFIIFAYINNNPNLPVITETSSQYFLFLRPLSYMSFWVDYHLFGDNYIAMKLVSLFLHILFIITVYYLLNRISQKFKLEIDSKIILLVSLILSIHLDSLLWIFFICNRTEQLMILFYVLSLVYFSRYSDSFEKKYLLLSGLFFLLSVLAKQTGLHLPIVFLLYFLYEYYSKKNNHFRNKQLIIFFIFSFLIIVLWSFFNFFLYHSQISISESVWKKPFTIISIIIHTIIPLYSNYIHSFFILNKSFATILLVFVLSMVVYLISFIVRRKKASISQLLFFVALFLTIFFPRIFAIGSQRLNGVILIWFSIAFLFVCSFIKNRKIILTSLFILFLFYSFSFYARANDIIEGDRFKEESFSKLVKFIDTAKGKTLILCSDTYDVLPYKYHYYSKKSFGKSDVLSTTPIFYEPILVNHDLSLIKKKFISAERENNRFTLLSSDPLIYFLIYENDENIDKVKILEKVSSKSGRGYKKLVFEITPDHLKSFDNIIYFNGEDWVVLD